MVETQYQYMPNLVSINLAYDECAPDNGYGSFTIINSLRHWVRITDNLHECKHDIGFVLTFAIPIRIEDGIIAGSRFLFYNKYKEIYTVKYLAYNVYTYMQLEKSPYLRKLVETVIEDYFKINE